MIRKFAIGIIGLIGLILVVFEVTFLATMPEALPENSKSAEWLTPGPYTVAITETEFVDETRETAANGDAPSLPNRTFPTSIWYPEDSANNFPLIIHSHGFASERTDLGYTAELLASYGYVVVAANFPLTAGGIAGGPSPSPVKLIPRASP